MAQNNQMGDLTVMIVNATALKDVESWGRMDPYVTLEMCGQSFRSKTRTDKGKHAAWNERFVFKAVSSAYATELVAKVFDANVMMSDTLIGTGRVAVSRAYSAGTTEQRVQLTTAKGKSAGELTLLLTWQPYGGQQPVAPAQPAAAHVQPAAPQVVYAAPPVQPAPQVVYAAPPMQPAPAQYYAPAPAPVYMAPPPAAPYPAPAYPAWGAAGGYPVGF